jgi:ribosomal protein L44E
LLFLLFAPFSTFFAFYCFNQQANPAPNQEASQKRKEQSFSQISRRKRRSLTIANLPKLVEAKCKRGKRFVL